MRSIVKVLLILAITIVWESKLFVIPVENNDVDQEGEEVGDDPSDSEHQCEQEPSEEKEFDDEGISKRKKGCEGENQCQIHGKTDQNRIQ